MRQHRRTRRPSKTPEVIDEKSSSTKRNGFRMPNIGMINLGDIFGMMPNQQRLKKKKPKEEAEPKKEFDIRSIPAPHKIKASLDDYVIGQEHAKRSFLWQSTIIINGFGRMTVTE